MMKRIFSIGMVILFILFVNVLSVNACRSGAAVNQPEIELDGAKIQAVAHIDGQNVYLPLTAVCEALGYEVAWSEGYGMVSVSKPGKNIIIDFNNGKITANDHVYYMSGEYAGAGTEDGMPTGGEAYMSVDFFSDNFGLKILWDRQDGKLKLESIKENPISIKTVSENTETDKIKMTLQFPQIEGLEDKVVEENINSLFRKAAEAAKGEGLMNANGIVEATDGYNGSPNKCETYFDYRLKYNQKGLLSVIFFNYQYAGGAHGLTVQSSYTFNLETGEEYTLKDLMRSDADYVSFISGIVKNQIDERIKEGLLPDYLLTPFEAIKDEQDFYLSNNALVVYFQQYEYFPYAAGIQEFAVDFSELKDMLKPEFSFLNEGSQLPNP